MTPCERDRADDEIVRPFRNAIQIGVVVQDIEKSMAALTAVFGIGPFRVADLPLPERQEQQFLDGQPVRFRARQAFADLGSVELELIQPLEGRTIWSDFLAAHGPGIHHIRFNVPDEKALTTYLRGKGISKTQEGAGIREGSYWANYDTEKWVGFVIEILQPAPGSDGRTPGVVRKDAAHDVAL